MSSITCPHCRGREKLPNFKLRHKPWTHYYQNRCSLCNGIGIINLMPGSFICDGCNGAGENLRLNSVGEVISKSNPCQKCGGRKIIKIGEIRSY